MEQEQFLEVIDRDEAERRFRRAFTPLPLEVENIPLESALGRVLGEDIRSPVDVPGFDRANLDGYAVVASDTFGVSEEEPCRLQKNDEVIATGVIPKIEVRPGTATPIATGAIVPRGADAVVPVEVTDEDGEDVLIRSASAPGKAISNTGSDIARGELVLPAGEILTSRETAILAAIGLDRIPVHRRPRVAILSTGNEIKPPGTAFSVGLVYDSNGQALADAVREIGGESICLGIVNDDAEALRTTLNDALDNDIVILSGGTSKGPGDVAYRVLEELPPPGIVVHGVALKPGKPLCLAVAGKTPIIILPGFPTSALFTFHEFAAPLINLMAGRREDCRARIKARLPVRVNSERGRHEYLLVNLVPSDAVPTAWPLGKGSGSVTTFSHADGFVSIDRNHEFLPDGSEVDVTLFSRDLRTRDLVLVGSHCLGLDVILSFLRRRGITSKVIPVGSEAGLLAAKRGECDVAGIHLLDEKTDTYNHSFLNDDVTLITGYGRMQGIIFRRDDPRVVEGDANATIASFLSDEEVVMVNRNRGSGTRILINGLVGNTRPHGYFNEVKTHNAVAAAIAAKRADFGFAIETVARDYGLGFLDLREENYDFVIPSARVDRGPIQEFAAALDDDSVREELRKRGFIVAEKERIRD